MTTFPFSHGRSGATGLGVILGLIGGLVAIAIEIYFTRGGYGSPVAGRMTELVTLRGYHVWVGDAVWWTYRAGIVAFLIGFALAAWSVFVRRARTP